MVSTRHHTFKISAEHSLGDLNCNTDEMPKSGTHTRSMALCTCSTAHMERLELNIHNDVPIPPSNRTYTEKFYPTRGGEKTVSDGWKGVFHTSTIAVCIQYGRHSNPEMDKCVWHMIVLISLHSLSTGNYSNLMNWIYKRTWIAKNESSWSCFYMLFILCIRPCSAENCC